MSLSLALLCGPRCAVVNVPAYSPINRRLNQSGALGKQLDRVRRRWQLVVLLLHIAQLVELPQEVALEVKFAHDVVVSGRCLDRDLLALNDAIGSLVGVGGDERPRTSRLLCILELNLRAKMAPREYTSVVGCLFMEVLDEERFIGVETGALRHLGELGLLLHLEDVKQQTG